MVKSPGCQSNCQFDRKNGILLFSLRHSHFVTVLHKRCVVHGRVINWRWSNDVTYNTILSKLNQFWSFVSDVRTQFITKHGCNQLTRDQTTIFSYIGWNTNFSLFWNCCRWMCGKACIQRCIQLVRRQQHSSIDVIIIITFNLTS